MKQFVMLHDPPAVDRQSKGLAAQFKAAQAQIDQGCEDLKTASAPS